MKQLAHFLAFVTISIWGVTFISSKVLLLHGISASTIFLYRFVLAYILLVIALKFKGQLQWASAGWKDEMLMMVLGVSGGSSYFLLENLSLIYTTTTNSSILVSSSPLLVAVIACYILGTEKLTRTQLCGSALALCGMALVVLNGRFVLHLEPKGDMLALGACFAWAIYTLCMIPATKRYNSFFLTRKVLFYGILSIIPWMIINGDSFTIESLNEPVVLGNLLFLGVVASALCFISWSWAITQLGAVVTNNWCYFGPISTIIAAAIILDEIITVYFLIGCAVILIGMVIVDRKPKLQQSTTE